jgi:putative MATE family efflux protein
MGPMGAALATVIGQAVSFLWALWYLYRNRDAVGFDFRPASFKPDGEVLPILIKLGIPMSLQFGAIHFSLLFVRSFLNDYGVVVSAVTGIGSKLNSVAMVVTNALTTAGSSMIGQNLGAEKFDRVPRIIRVIMTVNVCFVTLLSLVTIFFPKSVFGLFNNEAEVLEAALAYVPPAVLSFYGNGMRSPFFALINGSGNSRLNLLVGLLDGLVCRIGLAYFLGVVIEMGIEGFWYGSSLAGYMPVIIGLIYYLSKTWRAKPRAVRKYV